MCQAILPLTMCVCRRRFCVGVPSCQPRPYFHDAGFRPGLRSKVSLLVPVLPVDGARVVGQRVDPRPVDVDRVLEGLAHRAAVARAREGDALRSASPISCAAAARSGAGSTYPGGNCCAGVWAPKQHQRGGG